jgi:hypothetical protein
LVVGKTSVNGAARGIAVVAMTSPVGETGHEKVRGMGYRC